MKDRIKMKKGYTLLAAVCIIAIFSGSVSAANMFQAVINFIADLIRAFRRIGGTIAVIMFIYGGATYAFSADDPGGRKKGLHMCIASVVGGLMMIMADNLVTAIMV
ncbi:TrbC/VirB2 family protein [Candidatus Altiarchaeota archaeon]